VPAASGEPGRPMKILASLLGVFWRYDTQSSKLLAPLHRGLL
jgi:hypothetical protein